MIAVVLVAIPLVLQTLNVFQGIREHTVAVMTVRHWIIHDSVVMEGLRVRGKKVEIDLRLDMPLAAFGPQESLKPRRWIPPDMNKSQLEKSLSKALQRNIQVSLTGQFQLTNWPRTL
jgi:hypothetical protein